MLSLEKGEIVLESENGMETKMETKKDTQFVASRCRSVQKLVLCSKSRCQASCVFLMRSSGHQRETAMPTGRGQPRWPARIWKAHPSPCLRFELRKRDRDSGKGGVWRPLAEAGQRAPVGFHLPCTRAWFSSGQPASHLRAKGEIQSFARGLRRLRLCATRS